MIFLIFDFFMLETDTRQLANASYNLLWLVKTQTYLTDWQVVSHLFMQTKPVWLL